MQIRRGTLAAWAAASNPVLEPGELGFVTDVGKTAFKIGNTAGTGWDTLPYVNSTYPELDVSAGNNLNTSLAQGRYPLLSGSSYTNAPGDFTDTTTDGSSILLVTVPTNNIIIQELTTSLTPCKRWIRAYNGTPAVWTAWKRIDTLSASESLSITNLVLSGNLIVSGNSTVSGRSFVPPGSAVAPSITITGDTTTGIYQSAAQEIGIATDGVNRLKIGTSALTSTTTFSAVGVSAGASGLASSGGITLSSGALTLNAGTTISVPAGSVNLAALANIAATTVLGNSTGSSAAVTALTAGSGGTAKTALGLGTSAYSAFVPLPAFQVGVGVGQVKAASAIASVSSNDPITFGATGETWFVIVWKQWQNLGSTGSATIEVLTAPKNYVPLANQWGVIGFALRTA